MARSYARHAWPGLLLLIAGAIVAAVGKDETAVSAVGYAVGGIGAVVLVAVLFWEIGASEDRERAAQNARRRRGA